MLVPADESIIEVKGALMTPEDREKFELEALNRKPEESKRPRKLQDHEKVQDHEMQDDK